MAKDGGPAFPCKVPYEHWGDPNMGMTLRDYFAAAALTGALKDHDNLKAICESSEMEKIPVSAYIARSMYGIADAMLAEREKERT